MTECAFHTAILFEDPFWVALLEREDECGYSVARVVIGASEPTGTELVRFLDRLDPDRLNFTCQLNTVIPTHKNRGFKKQLHKNRQHQKSSCRHTYTKAHAMLKQQHEELKTAKQKADRTTKDKFKQLKFDLREKKKKEKHLGH
jgi:hypothetical protein